MLDAPNRLEGSRVGGQARDEMPVDVRELIAEELVVDFPGLKDMGEGFSYSIHFLHQLNPFRRHQVKQFGDLTLKDDDGPSRKELVVMQICIREAEVGNEVVGTRPAALAGVAGWLSYG
jgi:hypothetical protein